VFCKTGQSNQKNLKPNIPKARGAAIRRICLEPKLIEALYLKNSKIVF
jgi:hypothetical protein